MPRGGYQKPSKPAAVSGPGKFSRRTDGKITEPDIDKERGLQYGDRQASVDAQRIAKTAVGAGARVASPAGRRPTGGPRTGSKLPPWFSTTPDTNPSEPTTAGLSMGPGPGPESLAAGIPTDDERVVMMQYIAEVFGDQDAVRWLADYRSQEAAAAQAAQPIETPPSMGDGLAGLA